jgi:Ca2+:H+ antiporter
MKKKRLPQPSPKMNIFSRRTARTCPEAAGNGTTQDIELTRPKEPKQPQPGDTDGNASGRTILPTTERYNHNVHLVTKGIRPEGESGRKGIHPFHFLKICWRSSSRVSRAVNVLWPFVPAALAVRYATENHLWIFILNYIAMVPSANLIGFAGQELTRKLHKVFGVLLETTLGSVVEIVMFMVLVTNGHYTIIQDAILGSILATQLLCLGTCFAVGGWRHDEQHFDQVIGEVGSDLLLTA